MVPLLTSLSRRHRKEAAVNVPGAGNVASKVEELGECVSVCPAGLPLQQHPLVEGAEPQPLTLAHKRPSK
jgi:hypothetical protein